MSREHPIFKTDLAPFLPAQIDDALAPIIEFVAGNAVQGMTATQLADLIDARRIPVLGIDKIPKVVRSRVVTFLRSPRGPVVMARLAQWQRARTKR